MDLEEARVTAQKRIIEARLHNVEDSKIDMLTRWAEVVKSMLPAPPVDATGMMAPQATPETRPQSDLLPYAPQ
jgi:hypothetical protein